MPRLIQIVVALLLTLASLPVLLLAILMSSLFVGLPPLYTSKRVGLNGKTYTHLKLLTMKPGPQSGRVFFETARINWCGKLLRALHLDELPELFHIMSGTMNLVGPRPLPSNLLEGLDTTIRQKVRPGWTGPAQVYLARKGRLDKKLQIRLDNHYVNNRSTLYDLKIISATIAAVFSGKPLDLGTESTPDRRTFKEEL